MRYNIDYSPSHFLQSIDIAQDGTSRHIQNNSLKAHTQPLGRIDYVNCQILLPHQLLTVQCRKVLN